MRRWSLFLFVAALLATPAHAQQPRCPLPLNECLAQFGAMRDRPWLGVQIETDTLTGERRVSEVVPGGPADKAGVKPGDTLRKLGGADPQFWFAGKAGWKSDWKDGDKVAITVARAGRDRSLEMRLEHVSEQRLADMIGIHMIEAHLAYMEGAHAHEDR